MFAERLRKNIQGAASVLLAPATTCLLVLHLERAVLTDPRLLHCVWCGKIPTAAVTPEFTWGGNRTVTNPVQQKAGNAVEW